MRRRHLPLLSTTSLDGHFTGARKIVPFKVDNPEFGSTVVVLGGSVFLRKIVFLPLTIELCNKNNKHNVTTNPFIKYLFPLRDISLALIPHYFCFGFCMNSNSDFISSTHISTLLRVSLKKLFFVLCYQQVSATHTHNIFSAFCLREFAELKINNFMTCKKKRK